MPEVEKWLQISSMQTSLWLSRTFNMFPNLRPNCKYYILQFLEWPVVAGLRKEPVVIDSMLECLYLIQYLFKLGQCKLMIMSVNLPVLAAKLIFHHSTWARCRFANNKNSKTWKLKRVISTHFFEKNCIFVTKFHQNCCHLDFNYLSVLPQPYITHTVAAQRSLQNNFGLPSSLCLLCPLLKNSWLAAYQVLLSDTFSNLDVYRYIWEEKTNWAVADQRANRLWNWFPLFASRLSQSNVNHPPPTHHPFPSRFFFPLILLC